ncbi:hypothetical protein V8U24_12005 [Escherichia marmotae]|uniref:hypothetical protein n=1 Tax=Escherichia marmotae TaxID=1499973 RepID=UPI0030CDC716
MMPNRRPDKALAPHPALLPNSSTAVMSDAMLAHLIRPTVTQMMPNRRPDKALAVSTAAQLNTRNVLGCDSTSYPTYSDSNDAQP